jgi:hypothetical protein
MGLRGQCHMDAVTRFNLARGNDNTHNTRLANEIASVITVQYSSHKPCLKVIKLFAGVAQAGDLNSSLCADMEPRSSGQSQQVDMTGGDVFAHIARMYLKTALLQFIMEFAVNQMHLAQIGLAGVFRDPRAVFDGLTHVSVTRNPKPGKQINAGLRLFAKGVLVTATDSSDGGRGQVTCHASARPTRPSRPGWV